MYKIRLLEKNFFDNYVKYRELDEVEEINKDTAQFYAGIVKEHMNDLQEGSKIEIIDTEKDIIVQYFTIC